MTRARRIAVALATLTACALPSLAYACPVCFSAKDEASRVAFLGTTLFLTALPLVLIGGIIYWVAARSVEVSKQDAVPAAPEPVDGPLADPGGPAG